jgi:hypothetical protein
VKKICGIMSFGEKEEACGTKTNEKGAFIRTDPAWRDYNMHFIKNILRSTTSNRKDDHGIFASAHLPT